MAIKIMFFVLKKTLIHLKYTLILHCFLWGFFLLYVYSCTYQQSVDFSFSKILFGIIFKQIFKRIQMRNFRKVIWKLVQAIRLCIVEGSPKWNSIGHVGISSYSSWPRDKDNKMFFGGNFKICILYDDNLSMTSVSLQKYTHHLDNGANTLKRR